MYLRGSWPAGDSLKYVHTAGIAAIKVQAQIRRPDERGNPASGRAGPFYNGSVPLLRDRAVSVCVIRTALTGLRDAHGLKVFDDGISNEI